MSSVDELRQILGTDLNDTHKKKVKSLVTDEEDKNKYRDSDEIVYKDSSTFLKVSFFIVMV